MTFNHVPRSDSAYARKALQIDTQNLIASIDYAWPLIVGGQNLTSKPDALNNLPIKIIATIDTKRDDGPDGGHSSHFDNSSYGLIPGDTFAEGNGSATEAVSFAVSIWVKPDSLASQECIVAHWGSGAELAWQLFYNNSNSRFVLRTTHDGSTTVDTDADTLGAPSTGNWYHIVCGYDNGANEAYINVNNGGFDTSTPGTSGIHGATADGSIGAEAAGANTFQGSIRDYFYMGGKTKLSSSEITDLYNSGNGNTLI